MTLGQGMPVKIHSPHSDKTSSGTIRVQFWNKKERTLRALKFGSMCWGAAVVSVILPIAHFVLVPAFLIAGPCVAFFVLAQESVVLGGEGTCPSCESFLPIVRSSFQFPLSDVFGACHQSLKIEMA